MHSEIPKWLVFVLGASLGSFLNVCIYRLPREASVVWPPSHCPNCKKPVPYYDNIPLVSFLLLRGKCRFCSTPIAKRYWVVELLTAAAVLWLWVSSESPVYFALAALFFSFLLVATAVDLEFQIIPDEVSLGGLAMGLAASALYPALHREVLWHQALRESALGALAGGGLIYVTGALGTLAFKKEAMGGGDVKLAAMLGAFLGFKEVVLVYFIAPVLALPLALVVKLTSRSHLIPYGPFLSLAGWIIFFWGKPIIAWWLPAFGY